MKNYSILVVDDHPDNLKTIEKYLKESDMLLTIIKAPNGKVACKMAEKKLPDLIITDWEMPEMDGIETIKYLKSHETTKDIPIIMSTGVMTSAMNLNTAMEAGAVDYIRKPVEKTELMARVNSMLKLSTSYKKIKEQNILVNQQKEEISRKNKKITDSISYAKRIQTAILPPEELLQNTLAEHFILFYPKDIVSGDFYWVKHIEDYIIVAAADCTGHGVPGALMSMLGISILDRIVSYHNVHNPAHILNELSAILKQQLRQTDEEVGLLDGMDIALIAINKKENMLYYAGANNPLILVRENKIVTYNADAIMAGFNFRQEKLFTNNEIKIEDRDRLYIFSDGYQDQFGGKNGKKFMNRNFLDLILRISQKSMDEQKEIVSKTFEDWKGNYAQVDDVLVIGLKI